jgi:hypothetical protein
VVTAQELDGFDLLGPRAVSASFVSTNGNQLVVSIVRKRTDGSSGVVYTEASAGNMAFTSFRS